MDSGRSLAVTPHDVRDLLDVGSLMPSQPAAVEQHTSLELGARARNGRRAGHPSRRRVLKLWLDLVSGLDPDIGEQRLQQSLALGIDPVRVSVDHLPLAVRSEER